MKTPDPFTPRGALSTETLRAYAEGRLDPPAAHEVELHLEADPLLRDAMEGYRTPGAFVGAEKLKAHRPEGSGSSWAAWTFSAVVVAIAGAGLYYSSSSSSSEVSSRTTNARSAERTPTPPSAAEALIGSQEILAAIEIPESLHIGHSSAERHALSAISVLASTPLDTVARVLVDPVEPRRSTIPDGTHSDIPALERHQRPSLQLVYLHDLKLIHPKEVYGRSPEVDLSATGVDARFTSAAERNQARAQERRMAYLTFMDETLEKFVNNDHKGCLEDLRFVLDQYPDDVNALFYAGLCCYNLGMNKRAEHFLQRAAQHTLPVFDEEAEWYHALALERLGEDDPAQKAFERIARAKGFYSDRAAGRIAGK